MPKPPGSPRKWRSEARSSPELDGVARGLGERVRALRRQAEFSQEELGRRAGIDPKHVQLIEAGKTNPTVSTLAALAEALDVSLSELFTGVGVPASRR